MTIVDVRNKFERLEQKYGDENLLQCHNFSTTYPKCNAFQTNPSLQAQRSTTNRLSHGTAPLDVRVHYLFRQSHSVHIGYINEPAIAV
jgi:hypothetical protein